jgi:hypothetical protein
LKVSAQVRGIFCKSLDGQPCTVTLDELKNVVKVSAQVRGIFCKSLDGHPCTETLDVLQNLVKECAQVRKKLQISRWAALHGNIE